MFLHGSSEHSLDDKNRVVLPAALRKGLQEAGVAIGGENPDRFVLIVGDGARLELHLQRDWQAEMQKIRRQYRPGNRAGEDYLMQRLASAVEVQLDKNYRVLLPESMRKEVSIEREVVIVGHFEHIRIFGKKAWDERERVDYMPEVDYDLEEKPDN